MLLKLRLAEQLLSHSRPAVTDNVAVATRAFNVTVYNNPPVFTSTIGSVTPTTCGKFAADWRIGT